MTGGVTARAAGAVEIGAAIAPAGVAAATIAVRETMIAAGIQGPATINAAGMRIGLAIETVADEAVSGGATQTDLVSGVIAITAGSAAMTAHETANGGAMRPMQIDPEVKMAPLRAEGEATTAQGINSASARQDSAINADPMASVIDGALIVGRIGAATNGVQIAAQTVDAMHIETDAVISVDQIVAQIAGGMLTGTDAVTNAALIDVMIVGIPIGRGGAISAVWIGDVIAPAPTGIQRESMAGVISVMVLDRGVATAISAAIITSSTITTAIILLAGSMRVSAGTFIQPDILAIAMWSLRLSSVAAAVFRRSPSFATTRGDTVL